MLTSNASFSQNDPGTISLNPQEISIMLYGSSDELINGRLYSREHPLARGNPFLNDQPKMEGYLYIKGNKYSDQEIGYNIDSEKLILYALQKNNTRFEIELSQSTVDSFAVGDRLFVNNSTLQDIGFKTGFVEVVYEGSFLFVIKHKKIFMNQYNSTSPYGFYTNDKAEYFLIKENERISISSKKSLLNEFENEQNELKKYMKSVGFNFKKANKLQWIELLTFCDKQLTN